MKESKFSLRKFTSLYMTISFLIMIISGIILYIAPPGRIAHWSYWSMLGLTKTEWQNNHTTFTFLFVFAGLLHIMYNWKPILHYISTKSISSSKLSKELIISVIFSLFVFVGTYYEIQPFGFVLELGEEITDSWENENNEPPIPHAERLTISEFAKTIDVETNRLVNKLSRSGYNVTDTLITLEELAAEYNTTPNTIYTDMNNQVSQNTKGSFSQGSGFGRKSISEVFSENNIAWDEGIELLKKNGIIVKSDMRLKDIADENNVSPIEIISALGLDK